jgi:hypothetical protein
MYVRPILAVLIVAGTSLFAAPANAACTCVCDAGKPRAQCPSIFEKPPACPASVCDTPAVSMPPMNRRENCQIVQTVDPKSQRVVRQLICK